MEKADTKGTRQRCRGTPFIMPDGRPLLLALTQDTEHLPDRRRGTRRKHRKASSVGKKVERKQGWTSTNPTIPSTHHQPKISSSNNRIEMDLAEAAELAALLKVGQRRQRRFLNDKLLREMAGDLSAEDMEGLFKPIPFGDPPPPSVWQQVSTNSSTNPHLAELWEHFRSVSSDRQSRMLEKWQEHIDELKHTTTTNIIESADIKARNAAIAAALKGWGAMGQRGRRALLNASLSLIHTIECRLDELLHQTSSSSSSVEVAEGGETLVVAKENTPPPTSNNKVVFDQLEDGFQRLVCHALAEYHGLHSFSCDGGNNGNSNIGGKYVVVGRYKNDKRIMTPSLNDTESSGGSRGFVIYCGDVVEMLKEMPGRALNKALLKGMVVAEDDIL
jgi:hypothetical protein